MPRAQIKQQRGGPRDSEPWLERLETMYLVRFFEDEMQRLFLRGEVHGTTHLYNGQEAVSVGVCAALQPDDYVAATYRGHGAALAKGVDPTALAAELMGRETGVCGGRGGSMNVIDLEHGLVGCFGIVGGSIAAATGAALSASRQGRVAVAFFGDGASNQGYFHECLNFAAVLSLPVVFVCENNRYSEFTPMATVTAGADIAARGAAYAVRSERLDGNSVVEVYERALAAVEHARAKNGPTLLECLTYRQVGHSKSDPGDYRPEGELDEWLERDPIVLERGRLEGLGVAMADLDSIERRALDRVSEAIEEASKGSYPDPAATPPEYASS
jgi:acetoin:2,6-dichlorophenolindophenol oxidoreductase subunit alpha